MLRSGSSIRFTTAEVNDLAELGIDVNSVKSGSAFAARLEPWLEALAQVRPDLFEKIACTIAAAKSVQLVVKARQKE